jgi:aminopeptidase
LKKQDLARTGAKAILERCLGLSAGSHFVLLADEAALEVVDPLFQAAQDLDIQLTTLFYTRLQQMTLQDLGIAKKIISDADAALLAHTDVAECSRFRTKLVSQWRGTTRLGTMPGASRFILESSADMNDQFIIGQCRRLTLPLLLGRDCTITTFDHAGNSYELHFQLGGIERIPVQSTGILGPNAWGNVPSGEIFTAPLEPSADGDYLVNGAIGTFSLKDEEAVLTFRGGRLVEHCLLSTGASVPYLDEIRVLSEGRRDVNWNVIAEFGIGVNEGIREVTGSTLLDEKMFGSVHVAVGNNVGWQGENAAQIHLDIITKGPTVTISGKLVLERGQHVVKPEEFDSLADYQPHPRYRWSDGVGIATISKEPLQRDEHGEALIKLASTQSGRITEVPIANEQTRQLVSQVLRWSSERPPSLTELASTISPSLPEALLYRLLSLLWSYGIVTPERG